MAVGTAVIAGNGVSLTRIAPGRLLATDFIIRSNNFFFETAYHLGRRVDLAFMGGDPRVAPFMLETLWRCRSDYQLGAMSSFNPKVYRAAKRRFGPLLRPMRYRDDHIARVVTALCAKYDKVPMTGTYALLMAHGLGARAAILAGFDFHTGAQRYPFEPGRHYRDLMGADINRRATDRHLHDNRLDLELIGLLRDREDMALFCTVNEGPLAEILPPAPPRDGPPLNVSPRANPPTDWAVSSGLYPIHLLKLLRRGSRLRRALLTRKAL